MHEIHYEHGEGVKSIGSKLLRKRILIVVQY